MRKIGTITRLAPAGILVLCLTAACGADDGGSGNGDLSARTGTVTLSVGGDWETLNPYAASSSFTTPMSFALYDRLIDYDDQNREVVPYLAESWEESPSEVAFTMKDNITCADGTDLTPSAVADSLQHMVDEPGPFVERDFGPGPFTISADDAAGTVTFATETPFSALLLGFATPYHPILCPAAFAPGADLDNESFGSGPYTIDSMTRGEVITLKARSGWDWGPYDMTSDDEGFPGELVFKVVSSPSTIANLIDTGGLNAAPVTGPDTARLIEKDSLFHIASTSINTHPLWFNQSPDHPTADPMVRQALMMALDQDEYNQAANGGRGVVSSSFLIPTLECYDPETEALLPEQDIEAAKQILNDAGYTADDDGILSKDGNQLEIRIIGDDGQGSGPEYIDGQFKKLGVATTLSVTDRATRTEAIENNNYDVVPFSLNISSAAPQSLIANTYGPPPPDGANYGRLQDAVLESAGRAALGTAGCDDLDIWQQELLKGYNMFPLAASPLDFFGSGTTFKISVSTIDTVTIRRAP